MSRISSMKHPLVQKARSAGTQFGDSILLQDWAACLWALDAGMTLSTVFVCEGDAQKDITQSLQKQQIPFHWTTPGMMQKIKQTKYASPIVALCDPSTLIKNTTGKLVLILDQLQDPGNIGTIIRSARAFGVDHIGLVGPCALFHKKAISASRGHVFTGSYQCFDTVSEASDYYHTNVYSIVRTAMDANMSLTEAAEAINSSIALVVGNESDGCDSAWSDCANHSISIPMDDRVESLNVGVAASLCCYALSR